MNLTEMRARFDELKAELRGLKEKTEALSPDEETRFSAALDEAEALDRQIKELDERERRMAAIQGSASGSVPGASTVPGQINRGNPLSLDLSKSTREERRDAALQLVEERSKGMGWSGRQQQHMDRLLRAGKSANLDADYIAQRALITDSDAYHQAFLKGIMGQHHLFTPEERAAAAAYHELERRAASEGTMSAGGYGVPILIDPTIVLTSGALDAPILSIAKTVTITTDQWKGVTSTGLVFEYTAEAAVVADKTPTLAQPTIPVYRADGFIPYSFEIGQDYPGFAEEMAGLLEQGYVNLVASGTMTGSGSGQPTGLFTALQRSGGKAANGTSGIGVTVSTLGSLFAVDIRNAWSALGELFRQRSTWVMNVTIESIIRAFGNNLALSDFTIDLTQPGESRLTGRPVVLSDYAPAYVNTTASSQQFCVIGDFSKFLIVQRAGMTVEQVQHLFDPTTGRPTGQRGWLAWTRHGYNVLDTNPFRILSNGG